MDEMVVDIQLFDADAVRHRTTRVDDIKSYAGGLVRMRLTMNWKPLCVYAR